MNNRIFLLLMITFMSTQHMFGQFGPQNIIETSLNKITDIATVDINNDNFNDIVVTKQFNPISVSYFLNQGNNTFGIEQSIANNFQKPRTIASGDFNNDGWTDLVTGDVLLNQLYWHENNSGMFTNHLLDSALSSPVEVKVADVDLDNDLDIIAIGDVELYIYYNDGSGIFTPQFIQQGGIPTEYYVLGTDDIDGDGYVEILTGGTEIKVFKNIEGVFSYDSIRTDIITDNLGLVFNVELADFDNDDDIDLMVSSTSIHPNTFYWYTNDGNGNFTSPQIIVDNVDAGVKVSLSDFDNNGSIDLFTINNDSELVWFSNDGNGNFSASNFIFQASSWANNLTSVDINNDEKIDVIWGSELSFHLNNSSVSINEQEPSIFSLYPNPASSKIYIEVESDGELCILNNLGQIIYNDIKLTKGYNTIELDLKSQTYLLMFRSEGEILKRKLMIKLN